MLGKYLSMAISRDPLGLSAFSGLAKGSTFKYWQITQAQAQLQLLRLQQPALKDGTEGTTISNHLKKGPHW